MALTSTTLGRAAAAGATQIKVAAITGFAVGNLVQIDSEFFLVQKVGTTTDLLIDVIGGQNGTLSVAHSNGAAVVTGLPGDFTPIPKPRKYTYVVAGALTIAPGIHCLKTGAGSAMTLADPTADQEGIEMQIVALDAQAYTVTYTAGFAGGTTSNDVATFGGAIGDSMTIKVINGIWNHLNLQGVTVG